MFLLKIIYLQSFFLAKKLMKAREEILTSKNHVALSAAPWFTNGDGCTLVCALKTARI